MEYKAKMEERCEYPMIIRVKDVIGAMYKIGKKKASSYDGMMDIIFQK